MLATPARVISGSIDTKTADAAIHAETQALILDYLLFESTRTSLHELQERLDHGRRPDIKLGDDLLAILNPFLETFNATRGDDSDTVSEDLQFRFKLWKLTTLLTRRLEADTTTPNPEQIRALKEQETQAAQHLSLYDEEADHSTAGLTLNPDQIRSSCGEYLFRALNPSTTTSNPEPPARQTRSELGITTSMITFFSSDNALPLLALLPSFMHLSALCSEGLELTQDWMQLALGFMTCAVLEECLCRGAALQSTIALAFRWRWTRDMTSEADDLVNDMFRDRAADQELPAWTAMVEDRLDELYSDATDPQGLHDDLWRCMDVYALGFEQQLVSYLSRISEMTPGPVLRCIRSPDDSGRISTAEIVRQLEQRQETFEGVS